MSDVIIALQQFGEMHARFIGRESRQKTEAAAVDADDRHLSAGGLARDAQEGAVAADDTAGVETLQIAAGQGKAGGCGQEISLSAAHRWQVAVTGPVTTYSAVL